jgi:hypothetical protein
MWLPLSLIAMLPCWSTAIPVGRYDFLSREDVCEDLLLIFGDELADVEDDEDEEDLGGEALDVRSDELEDEEERTGGEDEEEETVPRKERMNLPSEREKTWMRLLNVSQTKTFPVGSTVMPEGYLS